MQAVGPNNEERGGKSYTSQFYLSYWDVLDLGE
jgi:hypothetical protein